MSQQGGQGGEPTPKTNEELNAEIEALKKEKEEVLSEFNQYKEKQAEVRDSILKRSKKEVYSEWESWTKQTFGITEDLQGEDLKTFVAEKAKAGKGDTSIEELEAKLTQKYQSTISQLEGKIQEKDGQIKTILEGQKIEKKTSYLTQLAQLNLKNGFKLSEDSNVNQARLSAVIDNVKNLNFSEGENPFLVDNEGTPIYEDGQKVFLTDKINKSLSVFFEKEEKKASNPLNYVNEKGQKVVISDNIQQLEAKMLNTTDPVKYEELKKQRNYLIEQQKK